MSAGGDELPAVSLLLLEDDPAHAEIVRRFALKSTDWRPKIDHRDTLAGALDRLRTDGPVDCVLMDLNLPDSSGAETIASVSAAAPDVPLVVLTSVDDPAFGYHAVQGGVEDFLVKSDLSAGLLMRSVLYSIERKRTKARLNQNAADLARVNRDLEQFARVVSHDLKTPLGILTLELDALDRAVRRGADAAQVNESIASSRGEVRRMVQLIDDLLTFARSGDGGERPAQLDLGEVVGDLVRRLRPQLDEAGADVRVDSLPKVIGARVGLAQVFQNLLSNALKYRAAERPLRVVIDHCRAATPGFVEVCVADNGIGVSSGDRERIFNVFDRGSVAHDPTTRPGSGVGLSICKRIVEAHGGRVWVEPNDEDVGGAGSRFHLVLPTDAGAPRAGAATAGPIVRPRG